MASHIAVKTCVILNPSAGSAGDTESLREKLARLSPNEIKITAEPGEAQRFARDAASLGCDLIISAGGDGTLNEVVNGVAEKNSSRRVSRFFRLEPATILRVRSDCRQTSTNVLS